MSEFLSFPLWLEFGLLFVCFVSLICFLVCCLSYVSEGVRFQKKCLEGKLKLDIIYSLTSISTLKISESPQMPNFRGWASWRSSQNILWEPPVQPNFLIYFQQKLLRLPNTCVFFQGHRLIIDTASPLPKNHNDSLITCQNPCQE